MISSSELVVNPDGSIYHLKLRPGQVARTIITVGDPDRVRMVSRHFDTIETEVEKREFRTHTGRISGKRITVISTGIGADNIDIVINELDALFNIDLKTRKLKTELTPLTFIRLGTSGALHQDIPVGSLIASSHGLGLDSLMTYYKRHEPTSDESRILSGIRAVLGDAAEPIDPYLASGSVELRRLIADDLKFGITATSNGFYGPQGRLLRAPLAFEELPEMLRSYEDGQWRITNFEMETAAIYGLGAILGHRCLSVNTILANRLRGEFSEQPKKAVTSMIAGMIERIADMIDY